MGVEKRQHAAAIQSESVSYSASASIEFHRNPDGFLQIERGMTPGSGYKQQLTSQLRARVRSGNRRESIGSNMAQEFVRMQVGINRLSRRQQPPGFLAIHETVERG